VVVKADAEERHTIRGRPCGHCQFPNSISTNAANNQRPTDHKVYQGDKSGGRCLLKGSQRVDKQHSGPAQARRRPQQEETHPPQGPMGLAPTIGRDRRKATSAIAAARVTVQAVDARHGAENARSASG